MKTIAVTNFKGGVGKTTVSLNLANTLARRGKRILLIDLDPQGTLSSWITIWNDSAQSRYDADADRHTIKVGGRRCCWRLLRLRHVASAEEIEHAQEIIWRNRDLL